MRLNKLHLYLAVILVLVLSTGAIANEDKPVIEHPEEVRIDQEFEVEILNLEAGQEYQIKLASYDEADERWMNQKKFVPESETFIIERDSTMELIQLMEPTTSDYEEPFVPPVDFRESFETDILIKEEGETIASSQIIRWLGDPEVEEINIDHPDLIGNLYRPPGNDNVSGALVLHGSEPSPADSLAYMLASNGIATLAIQYFGMEPEIPDDLVEVPLEYIAEAGEWMLGHDWIKGDQLGIIGNSRGGELALLAASYFDIFGSTVVIAGSGLVFEGIAMGAISPGAAWSYQDEPIDYISYTRDYEVVPSGPIQELEPFYSASYEEATEKEIEQATVSVENINGPVLMVSGKDDKMWNSVELQKYVELRLDEYKHPYEFKHLIYEDAGHTISFPYLPTANLEVLGSYYMGGSQEGYARADADHWPEVLRFLKLNNQ